MRRSEGVSSPCPRWSWSPSALRIRCFRECIPFEQLTTPRINKHYMWYQNKPCSCIGLQALAWNEDEETADSYRDSQEHDHNSDRAPVQRLLDEWLPDPVEVEEGVLAESSQGEDWVKHVLVGEDEVDGDGEWEDDLRRTLANPRAKLKWATYPAARAS